MQQLKQQPSTGLYTLDKTILVVEDDEDIGSMLVDVLSLETSCQIVLVTDAFQAMRVMHSIKPCLFITDYRLPQMDGIQLYDYLCMAKELIQIPTIIMSAHMPEDEVKKRHLVGLNKPFELDDLLDTIAKLMKN
jgi:DNA-binding NtrC family response regulator